MHQATHGILLATAILFYICFGVPSSTVGIYLILRLQSAQRMNVPTYLCAVCAPNSTSARSKEEEEEEDQYLARVYAIMVHGSACVDDELPT